MRRKVIKQGNGTLTITLPKKWTEEIGLNQDSEVELEIIGKALKVSGYKVDKFQKTELNLKSDDSKYIRQIITNLYLAGFDEIKVRYDSNNCIHTIRKVVDDLIGYDIIEQNKNSCKIKILSPVLIEEFDSLLRKIFLLLKNLFESFIEDLNQKKLNNSKQIFEFGRSIHRFTYYCRRIIIKKKSFDTDKSIKFYLLITRLLTVSHSITYIYKRYEGKQFNVSKRTLSYVNEVYDFFKLFYEIFYHLKLDEIHKIAEIRRKLLDIEFITLINQNQKNNLVIHYMGDIIRDIARNGGILYRLKEEPKDLI